MLREIQRLLMRFLILLYVIYNLILKYYSLKKKYSTLFDLKEKLDKLEEL